jgi:glycosyltransferase involved in cell wall biosynthesis
VKNTHFQEDQMPSKVRILTDHRIPQSDEWQRATCLIERQRFNNFLGSLIHALRVSTIWWKYDVLLSANVRNVACFGLIRRLLPFGAPKIVALELRMDDERDSITWRLKRLFQRFAFKGVDLICVSAREEMVAYRTRLGLGPERFSFIPWHTNVQESRLASSPNGYIFAAGRTGRDWPTFAEAVNGLPIDVVAVCSSEAATTVEFPKAVRLFSEIDYQHYRKLLLDSRIVVVPLEAHVYSSGQVAFLEAMALGKSVIVTDCVGSRDYISDGVNGLMVPTGDSEAMRGAILKVLEDQTLEHRLQLGALSSVKDSHTLDLYVRSVLLLAVALMNGCEANQGPVSG